MKALKLCLTGSLVIAVSACASQPDPIMEEAAPQVVAPEPVQEAEIIQQPIQEPIPYVADDLPIPGSVEDFAYRSGGEPRVYFGYDQFTLTSEARTSLLSQANWLNTYLNVNAIVEGHADERGTREYNLALAARRAEAVKSFLVSQGVAPSRLTTVSYGKERPIDARSNEEGWARNRNGFTNLTVGGFS